MVYRIRDFKVVGFGVLEQGVQYGVLNGHCVLSTEGDGVGAVGYWTTVSVYSSLGKNWSKAFKFG